MEQLLRWMLVHVGLLYLITEAAIASPIRRVLTLNLKPSHLVVLFIYCPACCGFWLGGAEAWLGFEGWSEGAGWRNLLLHALAGMGLGAWWAGGRYQLAEVFTSEQGHKLEPFTEPYAETDDHVHEEASAEGSSSERGAGDAGVPGLGDRRAASEGFAPVEPEHVDRASDPP